MTDKFDKAKDFAEAVNGASMDPREPVYDIEDRRQIARLSHHLIQSIIQEMPEPYGTTSRADAVWWQLSDLEDVNALYPMEFQSVFDLFVRNYNGGIE